VESSAFVKAFNPLVVEPYPAIFLLTTQGFYINGKKTFIQGKFIYERYAP
jgi:hypothetical protein